MKKIKAVVVTVVGLILIGILALIVISMLRNNENKKMQEMEEAFVPTTMETVVETFVTDEIVTKEAEDIEELKIDSSVESNDANDDTFIDEIPGQGQQEEVNEIKHITGVSNVDEMLAANAELKGFTGDINIIDFNSDEGYSVIYADSDNLGKKYFILLTSDFGLIKMGETTESSISALK